jgi:DNA repair protein RadC
MEIKVIVTESFGNQNKTYLFDLMQAVNGSIYLKIARSDKLPDETYQRHQVVVFEEDFELFRLAMRDLFASANHQLNAKEPIIRRVGTPAGIKNWDMEKRPREKFIAGGPEAVSDAELLAILVSSGSLRESAVSLAARILANSDYSLVRLSGATVTELCAFQGMGHAKSLAIMAAMELAKRLQEEVYLLGHRP